MPWIEIVMPVPETHAEALSDAFLEMGALSVSIEDADYGTEAEHAIFGEPDYLPETNVWAHNRLIILTDPDMNHLVLIERSCTLAQLSTIPDFQLRTVENQNWVELTQAQFEPIHVGEKMWVIPSWNTELKPEGLILKLDPGLAFGTGSHPTTRLCMEWLEKYTPQNGTVLDYGCGSGILAMVAKKSGSSQVYGVDIDPQAIHTAHNNALHNECIIEYHEPDAFIDAQTNGMIMKTFDVVVANILANPLIQIAKFLSSQVSAAGSLVLSGILSQQAEMVMTHYAPFIKLSIWKQREGWVVLVGQKRPI